MGPCHALPCLVEWFVVCCFANKLTILTNCTCVLLHFDTQSNWKLTGSDPFSPERPCGANICPFSQPLFGLKTRGSMLIYLADARLAVASLFCLLDGTLQPITLSVFWWLLRQMSQIRFGVVDLHFLSFSLHWIAHLQSSESHPSRTPSKSLSFSFPDCWIWF